MLIKVSLEFMKINNLTSVALIMYGNAHSVVISANREDMATLMNYYQAVEHTNRCLTFQASISNKES